MSIPGVENPLPSSNHFQYIGGGDRAGGWLLTNLHRATKKPERLGMRCGGESERQTPRRATPISRAFRRLANPPATSRWLFSSHETSKHDPAKSTRIRPTSWRSDVSSPLLTIPNSAAPGDSSAQVVAKRALDLTGAVIGLVVLFPLLLAMLLIRLSSPGPILFRQVRRGRGGRPFWFLKFRTMTVDAEQRLGEVESLNESSRGVLFKIRHDPRVTPREGRYAAQLGRVAPTVQRAPGRDESGRPSAAPVGDCDLLEAADSEGYARRLRVLPGLTGAWQVGGRSETDYERMLQLDLDYVENQLFRRDLWILCQTVGAVLRGRGGLHPSGKSRADTVAFRRRRKPVSSPGN